MVQFAKLDYTVEEYLEIEDTTDVKHEYIAGLIRERPGGLPDHNRIALNVLAALTTALDSSPREPFGSDQRVLAPSGLFAYPDVSVFCDDLKYADNRKDTVTNPTILVEVLSNSTRAYDRGEKFEFYRAIPSLRDYVLIEQAEMHVEVRHCEANDEWVTTIATSADDTLQIPSLHFQMPLRRVYTRVQFGAAGST